MNTATHDDCDHHDTMPGRPTADDRRTATCWVCDAWIIEGGEWQTTPVPVGLLYSDQRTCTDADSWDVLHPGRWSHNGKPQPKLPRPYGPPRDEDAWARRLAEMQAERTAENIERGAWHP